jgi:hypothetical protein
MSLLTSQVLSYGAMFLLVSGFIAYGYFTSRFVKELRTRHERIWIELGSPKVVDRSSSNENRTKFFQYLNKQFYRQLNDKSLNQAGDLARKAMYFMMVSTPLSMVLMFTVGFICIPGTCR